MPTRAAVLLAGLLSAVSPAGLVPVDPPARPGSLAPNLALDGNAVLLSWLEPAHARVKPQDGNYALRMSRFERGRWSPPVTIASGSDFLANWADFPSVTSAGGGRLLAHWAAKSGGEKYSYDVRLARSVDGGITWRPLGTANDDHTPTEHGFVSAVAEGDRVRLFWLDGRETGPKKGAMALRTAVVGDRVGKSELLDSRVCDCCQTDAAATAAGPAVVYRDRSDAEVRDVAVVRRGRAGWTAPRRVHGDGWAIDGCPVNGPAAAASGSRLAVAWYTGGGSRPSVQVAFSDDAGASFGPSAVLDGAQPLGRVDVVLDGNRDALVAWMASRGTSAAIRLARVTAARRVGPAVDVAAADPGRSSGFPRLARSAGTLLVAWVDARDPWRIRAASLPASLLR